MAYSERPPQDPQAAHAKKLAFTEQQYLFGNSRESNAAAISLAELKKERDLYSTGNAEPIEEFYEASENHRILTDRYAGLELHVAREAQAMGKTAATLSDNEYASICAGYENIGAIAESEKFTIEGYAAAGAKHWEREKISNNNEATLLGLNVEYRQSLRIAEKKERTAALEAILSKMRLTIESLPNDGKKREWELICILNGWSLETGHANAINAMHADPRTDTKDKIDTVIYVGHEARGLQIFTVSELETDESKAGADARKAAKTHSSIGRCMVSREVLDRIYDGKDKIKEKQTITNELAVTLPEKLQPMIALLYPDKREASTTGKRALMRDLPRVLSVGLLLKLGALAPEDASNITKILEAKKAVTEAVEREASEGTISSVKDFDDLETVHALRASIKK